MNPHWEDLAQLWSEVYKPTVTNDPREIPRPAGEDAGLRDDASEWKSARGGQTRSVPDADEDALIES